MIIRCLPGAPNCLRPRMPKPMTYAATFVRSSPSRPSRMSSSWGAMPENQASGSIEDGGMESSREAKAMASGDIFVGPLAAPSGFFSSELLSFKGCTAKMNSRVARTPYLLKGTAASKRMNSIRSHSGTRPGRTKVFRAGTIATVLEL